MREVREAIHGNTQRQVDVLQYDARDRLESDSGKHILALAGLPFPEQQLTALEAAFREAQEERCDRMVVRAHRWQPSISGMGQSRSD